MKIYFLIIPLFLSGCSFSHHGISSEIKRPEMIAVKAPSCMKIDGNIEEKEWKNAVEYQLCKLQGSILPSPPWKSAEKSEKEPFESAKVKLMYDSQYLYAAVSLEDRDIVQYGHENTENLFLSGDTFEFFLKPEESPSYCEFHVTPSSLTKSFFMESQGYPRKKTPPQKGLKLGIKIRGSLNNYRDIDKGWDFEFAIPLELLNKSGCEFLPGKKWSILIARYNYTYGSKLGGPQYSVYPNLPILNFHLTEHYANLHLK